MVAVAAILEHRGTGRILLLRRSSTVDHAAGVWEGISGRIHQGEGPETALRREIQEETGITEVEILQPLWVNHFFRGPQLPAHEVVYIAYWCRTDSREVSLSEEHTVYQWVAAEEAKALVASSNLQPSITAFLAARALWDRQSTQETVAMRIPVRRLDPHLPLPSYARPGDAGLDLFAATDVTLGPGARAAVPTGVAVAIPEGYAGFVQARSGRASRDGLAIVNGPGLVDSGYRGEIKVIAINLDPVSSLQLRRGDRIAQLVVLRVPHVDLEEVSELPPSERGSRGHGSTGR
jgi:dUTP pyrophosphatase